MLRFAFLFIVAVGAVTLVTRAPGPRRLLYVLLGLAILYTVLKLTGVVDALAPGRMGYLDTSIPTG